MQRSPKLDVSALSSECFALEVEQDQTSSRSIGDAHPTHVTARKVGAARFNYQGDAILPNIYFYRVTDKGFDYVKPAINTGYVL